MSFRVFSRVCPIVAGLSLSFVMLACDDSSSSGPEFVEPPNSSQSSVPTSSGDRANLLSSSSKINTGTLSSSSEAQNESPSSSSVAIKVPSSSSLACIHNEDSSFACGQRTADFIGEVHMPRGVDHVLLLHADSNITYVFKDGPAPKIDGMWNLDSVRVSESNAFISFDDNFDATLEISKGEFVLTFGLKGNDAGPIGKDIFGGSSPIFPRSDFIHKMYQALNGDGYFPLYIDDITSNATEMFYLIRADSSKIKVTTKAYKDSSVTFVLNGTTYTATLDSFVQNYYEGKEALVSIKKDDTVCKWHQKEKNVTQDLCKIEYMDHLNEDENVYSESGRAVTKYWEGNRNEFTECLKGIATPMKK